MNFARSGSPGIRTVLAKSPFTALLCGVGIEKPSSFSELALGLEFLHRLDDAGRAETVGTEVQEVLGIL